MSVYQHPSELQLCVDALAKDLLREEGPQISTVRNYNFAILPYDPALEFSLREAIHRLCEELRDAGWNTGIIPLHSLLIHRLQQQEEGFIQAVIQREKLLAKVDAWRGLRNLKERVVSVIEGPDGIAKDVISEIEKVLQEGGGNAQRTVIFLGRAGALYPFLRTSALLKHVAGYTHNIPIILLYPGKVVGETGLSFMGVLPADRDYRPRIYR